MRNFVLSLAATLAFAGAGFAQTTSAGSNLPEVLRGTSNKPAAEPTTTAAKPAAQKASLAHSAATAAAAKRTTPQTPARLALWRLRARAVPLPPPPLDTTSPRTPQPGERQYGRGC